MTINVPLVVGTLDSTLSGLTMPTTADQAANKAYVDSMMAGTSLLNFDQSSPSFNSIGTTSSAGTAGANTFTTNITIATNTTIAFRSVFNAQIYTVSGQVGTTVTFSPVLLAADAFSSGNSIYQVTGTLVKQTITDIALGTGLSGTLNSTQLTITATGGGGGSGTVTSVALTAPTEFTVTGSPITASGTLAITKTAQLPNLVWAGPSSGSTAVAPTFRALVTGDLGTGTANNTTFLRGDLTWATPAGGGGGVTQIVAGTNVTISPAGGTGIVTINSTGGGASNAFNFGTYASPNDFTLNFGTY